MKMGDKRPLDKSSDLNNYILALDLVTNENELRIYDLMCSLCNVKYLSASVHFREELDERYAQKVKEIENET